MDDGNRGGHAAPDVVNRLGRKDMDKKLSRVWFSALAVLAAAVVLVSGASASSAHRHPSAMPDTYVADWDAIGTQAFSAAGLTRPKAL
jgi:hypothetical protein